MFLEPVTPSTNINSCLLLFHICPPALLIHHDIMVHRISSALLISSVVLLLEGPSLLKRQTVVNGGERLGREFAGSEYTDNGKALIQVLD